jgi:hypothetical protein
MAGRYINTSFWKDSYIVDLETDEKLLFLYLLTNHQTNIAGIYELSIREMAFDTDIDKKRIEIILAKFIKDKKLVYINGWVALNNWIKHQSKNPKVVTGIHRIVENLPDWLQNYLLHPEDDQLPLLEDSQPIGKDSLSKPIALNLTKLNLTKPNGTAEAEGSKEPVEKINKKNYAKSAQADREQEARVAKTRNREYTQKPEPAVDPYALREGRKR